MKYVLTLLGGLVLGGALVYLLFVGAPGARQLPPGDPVAAPDPSGPPPGTALVTLNEPFFNTLLTTIFRDLGAPAFPLQLGASQRIGGDSLAPPQNQEVAFHGNAPQGVRFIDAQGGGCPNEIRLAEEGSGVRTGVRFVDGKIMVPIAFNGSYSVFGQCANFRGWAQANFQLIFNAEQQTLYGRINVEGVNLEGVAPFVGGFITPLVQNAINQRVGDIEVLRAQQLTLAVPVATTGGTLRARVSDVRAEIADSLRLFITYNFNGERSGGAQSPVASPPQS